MNKHTRLVVALLFIVIILLAAAIFRFYRSNSQNAGSSSDAAEIIRKLSSDKLGNDIFEGENGLVGVADSGDRIIVEPEWTELQFAGENNCIASKRIGGRMLTGCIDLEGNVTVPVIYKNITPYSFGDFSYYLAESDTDGSCIIYDESFAPLFMNSWDSCIAEENGFTLTHDDNIFSYTCGEDGLTCTNADISGEAMDRHFSFSLSSRAILSQLSCNDLAEISDSISDYLSFAFTGDRSYLGVAAANDEYSRFSELFADAENVTSKKLLEVSDVFVYSKKSDSGQPLYIASVTVMAEIQYTGADGNTYSVRNSYKASLYFGCSDTGVYAQAGSFTAQALPVPESAQEETSSDDADGEV